VELIPAIDLLGGRVVRLSQGRYDAITDYGADPVGTAMRWVHAGATRLHLVDLEGAREGEPRQYKLIAQIVRATGVPCQVAGGIRTSDAVQAALVSGADRVVLGSALVRSPDLAPELIATYGRARIVAAIDVRDGQALGDGWLTATGAAPAQDVARTLGDAGVGLFAVTAVARDGMLEGPDLVLLRAIADAVGGPHLVIASGGISSVADVVELAAGGFAGALLGRALYERRIELPAAIAGASQAEIYSESRPTRASTPLAVEKDNGTAQT
jgi:phosphoribosylformimino-5-aminoimidazole carboxamide ribotide isomerase